MRMSLVYVLIILMCLYEFSDIFGKVKVKLLSRVRLFATPWTVAYQASPSMGFSRQEYWSGLPSLVEKKKLLTTQPQPSDQG